LETHQTHETHHKNKHGDKLRVKNRRKMKKGINMNKTSQLLEIVVSMPLEYVKNLRKMHKLKKIIKSYLSNLFDYGKTYSEDILSYKTKNYKNKKPHFHFLVIPAYKKSKNIKLEGKS